MFLLEHFTRAICVFIAELIQLSITGDLSPLSSDLSNVKSGGSDWWARCGNNIESRSSCQSPGAIYCVEIQIILSCRMSWHKDTQTHQHRTTIRRNLICLKIKNFIQIVNSRHTSLLWYVESQTGAQCGRTPPILFIIADVIWWLPGHRYSALAPGTPTIKLYSGPKRK